MTLYALYMQKARISQQSTNQKTLNEYYNPSENIKKLVKKLALSTGAVSRSREKVQSYLSNLVKDPTSTKSPKTKKRQRPMPTEPQERSYLSKKEAGRIVNQSQSLSKYYSMRVRTECDDKSKKHNQTPHQRYLLNQQIIKTLIESVEEEKKSNRIFKKQLRAKLLLLNQLKNS